MWNKCITVMLLCFVTNVSYSKDVPRKIDSLKKRLISSSPDGMDKIDILNQIGYEYWIVDPQQSISYGTEALKLSKKMNYKKGLGFANRVIGVAYWAEGYFINALQYLYESQKAYMDIGEVEGLANTSLNIGMVYAELEQYDMALDKYNKAIDQFKKLNLTSRVATAYTKMASILIVQGRTDAARQYLNESLRIHDLNNFKYGIAEVHNRLGTLYLKECDAELAYNHIQISMLIGSEILDIDGLTSNYILMGKINRYDNELDLAEKNIYEGLRLAKENHLKKYELSAYEELIELKKINENSREALIYAELYMKLKDSLFNIQKANQIAYLEFEGQLQIKENQEMAFSENEKNNKVINYIISAILVLLSAVFFFIYKSEKKSKKLLEKEKKLLSFKNGLAQQTLENLKLKEKELMKEVEAKDIDISLHALNVAKKNEILLAIQDKLRLIKNDSESKTQYGLNNILSYIEQHLSDDQEWGDFKNVFENAHSHFYSKLTERHPNLKSNDLKICSLARLNLNIKETATIMGISPESIKTARYRLRKKLGLKPTQDIVTYLIEVEND